MISEEKTGKVPNEVLAELVAGKLMEGGFLTEGKYAEILSSIAPIKFNKDFCLNPNFIRLMFAGMDFLYKSYMISS